PPRSLALVAIVIAALLIVGYLLWRRTLVDEPTTIPVAEAPAARPQAPPAAPSPQAAAGQPVTLVATGEVWLRITDGPGGPVLYMGSMTAGASYQLPATAQHPVIRTGRPQNLHALLGTRDLGPLLPQEQVI